jgi:RNA polymerase sigma-70 factor, ECF subfamily
VSARLDERAFGRLYDLHTPYLYRFALRLTGGDEAEAEEVVHDAWVRAVECMERFDQRSSLRTWIAGIMVNCMRERRREQVNAVGLELVSVAEEDEGLAFSADRVDLERAIAALPAGYRHVFVLHDVEGWTHQDIAAALGLSVGTSKSQLFRARAALRSALSGRTEGERNA